MKKLLKRRIQKKSWILGIHQATQYPQTTNARLGLKWCFNNNPAQWPWLLKSLWTSTSTYIKKLIFFHPGFSENRSGFRWHTHSCRIPLTPRPCSFRFYPCPFAPVAKQQDQIYPGRPESNSPSEAFWPRVHGKMIGLPSFLTTTFEVLVTHF